jgi:hypothetical protein
VLGFSSLSGLSVILPFPAHSFQFLYIITSCCQEGISQICTWFFLSTLYLFYSSVIFSFQVTTVSIYGLAGIN